MSSRLFNPNLPLNSYLSYKLLDAAGNLITDYNSAACFREITYKSINRSAAYIVINRSMSLVPYEWPIIQRWVTDMTEFGFPMTAREIGKGDGKSIEITLDLKNYERKVHMSSALCLARCIFEVGIALVPELYYAAVKEGMSLDDRFDALQTAHKDLVKGEYRNMGGSYANSNHMATYKGNGTNIKHSVLFERFAASRAGIYDPNQYSDYYVAIDATWRGK